MLSKHVFKDRHAARTRLARTTLCAAFSLIIVFMPAGSARSFEINHPALAAQEDMQFPIITTSPAEAEDKCLPLLRANIQDGPSFVTDRTRRPAGSAAALGLVFGVRFALGPKEVNSSRGRKKSSSFDFWQPTNGGGTRALAVADYRRCKNEAAIKEISDWRWTR